MRLRQSVRGDCRHSQGDSPTSAQQQACTATNASSFHLLKVSRILFEAIKPAGAHMCKSSGRQFESSWESEALCLRMASVQCLLDVMATSSLQIINTKGHFVMACQTLCQECHASDRLQYCRHEQACRYEFNDRCIWPFEKLPTSISLT